MKKDCIFTESVRYSLFFATGTGCPVVWALYDGTSKTLFAFTAAGSTDFIIFNLMMLIHKEISIGHGDAVQIFGQIHLLIHGGAFLLNGNL